MKQKQVQVKPEGFTFYLASGVASNSLLFLQRSEIQIKKLGRNLANVVKLFSKPNHKLYHWITAFITNASFQEVTPFHYSNET